jgi:hydroxyacylglutathione hydrolase
VFIASFPAGPWQTNCYVVATEPGAECLILDPGLDAANGVRELVAEHRLKPVAVVLTHGHLDHMFSVAPLCGGYDATCWIHPDDRHLLADPLRAMGPETAQLLAQLTGGTTTFAEPDDVRELTDGAVL